MIPFNQVFARYAKDLLEKQTYPEVRRSPGAPAEAPYDVSAWSLGMQFGVKTEFAKTPLAAFPMEKVAATPKFVLHAPQAAAARGASPTTVRVSAMVVNRLLKGGAKVSLTKPEAGSVPYVIAAREARRLEQGHRGFRSHAPMRRRPPKALLATTLNAPRVGIYQSYDPSMDEGWTRWVLDHYQFDYTKLHNEDIKPGDLRKRFDAIILPDQRVGLHPGTASTTRRSSSSIAAASAMRAGMRCASSSPMAAR